MPISARAKPSRSDLVAGLVIGAVLAVGVFLYLGNEPQAKGQADSSAPPAPPASQAPPAPPASQAPEAVSPFGQLNAALSQAAARGIDPRAIAPGLKIDASGVQIPSAPVDVWFAVHVAGRTEFVRWSMVQGFIAARTTRSGQATCAIIHQGGHSVSVMRSAEDIAPAMIHAANAAYLAAAQGAVLPTVVIDIDGGPSAP